MCFECIRSVLSSVCNNQLVNCKAFRPGNLHQHARSIHKRNANWISNLSSTGPKTGQSLAASGLNCRSPTSSSVTAGAFVVCAYLLQIHERKANHLKASHITTKFCPLPNIVGRLPEIDLSSDIPGLLRKEDRFSQKHLFKNSFHVLGLAIVEAQLSSKNSCQGNGIHAIGPTGTFFGSEDRFSGTTPSGDRHLGRLQPGPLTQTLALRLSRL
jgi:hypothetical protein